MPVKSQTSVNDLLTNSGTTRISLALYDLASRAQLLVRPDEPFHPASIFKVGVMMEVFHQAFMGEYSLEDPFLVKNEFRSIADGSPFACDPGDDSETDLYTHVGEKLPTRDLVRRMIASSSNLATNLLVEKTGAEQVTQFMHDLGASDFRVLRGPEDDKAYALGMNNSITARSLMIVLVQLARNGVVSKAASQMMIEILLQQQFNDGIPARLPAGVKVAHKTGWTGNLHHDAGIIFPPDREPYVLVILTDGLSEAEKTWTLVAALSDKIYRQVVAAA